MVKPMINFTRRRPLGLLSNAGNSLMRVGKTGKAFVLKLNPFTGKMKKVYGVKAVRRRQGILKSMKGVPMANRPRAATLRRLRK